LDDDDVDSKSLADVFVEDECDGVIQAEEEAQSESEDPTDEENETVGFVFHFIRSLLSYCPSRRVQESAGS
jgi:hypothetical protein